MPKNEVKLTAVHETSVFTKLNDIKWREETLYGGNNLLMYSSKNKRVYCSNPTGGHILLLCDGKHTLSDIVENTAQMYCVDKKIIREDIVNFIQILIKNDLVKMGTV